MSVAQGADRVPASASTVVALLTVATEWDARLGEALRPLSLTTRKYGLLAHIAASPGISFSELARRSQITVQSAHTAVRSLVTEKLVQDATAHAGAASALRVTPRGIDALATAADRVAELDAALAAETSPLAAALRALRDEPHAQSARSGG